MKKLILSLLIMCSALAYSQGTIPIPQIIGLPSALASKVDKVTGKSLVADTSIVKLTGIQSGSQVNKIEGIQKNGVDLTITGKKVNITVPTTASDISAEPANTNIQSHISSTSNPHSVTKSQVGLGNVDNTSDINKPISTATQTALDGKQLIGTYATGTGTANGTNTGDETLTSIKTKLGAATSVSDGYLKYQDRNIFNSKQAELNGTGFVKTNGTTVSYDNSTYLKTSGGSINGYIEPLNIKLPTTTTTEGIIYKSNSPFIHTYSSPTSTGQNLFIGYLSGNFTMNNGVGDPALASYNTGIGERTLSYITNGYNLTAVGHNALTDNTSGYSNTAIGVHALLQNTTGVENTATGGGALAYNLSGSGNTAVGTHSLMENSSDFNTAIGEYSGYGDRTDSNYKSAIDSKCVFLGALASRASTVPNTTPLDNSVAIGYHANVSKSNSMALGGIGSYAMNVVIGATEPYASKLDVRGNIAIPINGGLYASDGSTFTKRLIGQDGGHTLRVGSQSAQFTNLGLSILDKEDMVYLSNGYVNINSVANINAGLNTDQAIFGETRPFKITSSNYGAGDNTLWTFGASSNVGRFRFSNNALTLVDITDTGAATFASSVTAPSFIGNGSNLTGIQLPITLTTNGTSGAATFSGNVLNVPNYTSSGGVDQTLTTVNGSTSGNMVCSMPFQTGSYKKVIIYVNSLNGSATYTFPTQLNNRYSITTNTLGNAYTSVLASGTSVTINGATNAAGVLIIEGY